MKNRPTKIEEMIITKVESPVGLLLAGATSEGLCLLEFTDPHKIDTQIEAIKKRFSSHVVRGENRHTEKLKQELSSYFAGTLRQFSLPLIYAGTPFQMKVWNELRRIPYGETISYEELARRVSSTSAQRAVGQANGLNPIAIVIPCHRVVNKSGKLGGYGGGLWRKKLLLDLEGEAIAPRLFHGRRLRSSLL